MSGGPRGAAPRVGETFGHYRIEQVIGVGGMGMVLGARDLNLGRPVAVKVVLGQYAESGAFLERFQREAATLARLDSPHVISIYDHGEQDGWPFIVTQYAGGGELGQLLLARGAMPPGLALQLCAQVADALVAAHAVGVVHRDVKPANVLLRDDRLDRLHVYLCDFGVALTDSEGSTGLTSPGSVAGTWNYLAPERVDGEPGSPASDIYAVGCLLWETLTGRPPYAGSDVEVALAHVRAPVPQLPGHDDLTAQIDRILATAMAKDPALRYPSAAAVRDDLRAVAGLTTTGTGSASVGGPTRRRRRVWAVAVAAAVVLVLVAAGGVALARRGGDPAAGPAPTGTSAAPPTSGATTPAVSPAVPGDLDDDGYGDVAWADTTTGGFLDDSDGSRLASRVTKRPGVLDPTLVGDVDGDGTNDLVEVSGNPPLLAVTVSSRDDSLPTTPLSTPRDDADKSHLPMALADVDGDGHDDLVFSTQLDKTTTISVATGNADSTFSPPRAWATTRVLVSQGGFVVSDFDGDGVADVGVLQRDPYDQKPGTLQVLRSDPSERRFRVLGRPLTVPEQVGDTYVSLSLFAMGDVDGDGHDELVGVEPYEDVAVVWRWNGETFSAPQVWHDSDAVSDKNTIASTSGLSDVNGDGRVDLVLLGTSGVRVLVSDGTAFVASSAFKHPATIGGSSVVLGPTAYQEY